MGGDASKGEKPFDLVASYNAAGLAQPWGGALENELEK